MYAFSWAEKSPVGPSCISWANGHSFRHILLGQNRLAGSSDIICWVNTKPTGQRLGPKSLAEPFRDDMDIEYPAGPICSSFRDIYTGPIRHSQYLYPNTIGPLILLISHLADPPAWVLFQAVGPSVISYAWAHIGWPASLGRFSTFGCPTKSGNVTEGARPGAGAADIQLFKMGLFPASFLEPKTAFTFDVLNDFLLDNLECGTSAMNYYSKLRRMTTTVFPHLVPDRYRELMRVARQWRKLKLLKRNGFGHEERKSNPAI
ncbi:uncharacterized protein HD556DRAFT_1449943 [Suillus plorans]|uniref:CxC2-like cysteine cluster KDZ transposase-associated domain-containing protein n=1 Tax=Suillus plorans TaxID=116603 RepID=A0A9P7ABY7_9AGAM|nr:uncharacterized protein HD556DRAFT_1449943 [Suillus plorans]KAG1786208.1 hypothetical protein HD556DRAFT_1449943 [Suillus plorans]